MAVLFALGSVEFFGTEVPEQLLGLGGREAIAVHEFPGGTRTIQPFGAFPTPIRWNGILTGSLALERSVQIDRMRVSGQQVPLIYGPFYWLGYVQSFIPEPRHEWLVPYKLVFQPEVDLSGAKTPSTSTATPESAMSAQLNTLSALQQGTGAGLWTLPSALSSPVGTLITDTTDGLAAATGGLVSGIAPADATTILSDVSTLQAAAKPLLESTAASTSSPAMDAYVAAGVIGTLVRTAATTAKWTISAVNPNLWMLAAQYLGDATRWQEIAALNGLTSPLQLGTYPNLMIPAP